ncbi:MAG: cbb3-type cytochrome c oxidase subunit I [Bacteroidetes bacterium]|nr:cbb3-type cytochrome c oxidase subunit I [Bacteroidota bacterium]MCX7907813.1 cbb3-type cytochrome c oxidase subunit I [Bacteroidota bacterium]MDW8138632.1 cbb3-type cytochrome c oxidase subunit I [Bacteroidota bacterium]
MAHEASAHVHEPKSFWTRYIFSQDHKVIAAQYILTSLLMGFLALVLSWLMRLQLGWPEEPIPILSKLFPGLYQDGILKPEAYLALITMHGTLMVFFFITAILLGGFGNLLIPLQVGARDMAFPFVNMLSYWVFLLSCVVILASFFVTGGAAAAGWTAYPPLSGVQKAVPGSGLGQDLWLVAMAIFIVSSVMGGLNYVTTALNMRTRGMSMGRLPLTVWALLITAILGLLAFPALFAGAVLLLLDRHLGTSFFVPYVVVGGQHIPHEGGNPLLWQHLFWFLGHPEVYIAILPAMGIVSEVISTNARKPIFGYRVMVLSICAIAFLSFIVWGHHMFISGMNPYLGTAFMVTTLLIAVPSAIKTFNWIATLWRGNLRFTPAMLFAIGFVSVFVTGGLTGIFLGNPPVDIQLTDTYFVVAHFHIVMGMGSVFGIFAGLYHWFPKLFGRMMNERLGRWHFWLTFVGVYGIFFPMHYLGFLNVPRRYYGFSGYEFIPPDAQTIQAIISVAALLVGAAQLIFLYNFLHSWIRGPKAPANPWQATTLEWQAPSPPPHGNWGPELPVVHRWAYDYAVPGAAEDYVPQTTPVEPAQIPQENGAGKPASEQNGV